MGFPPPPPNGPTPPPDPGGGFGPPQGFGPPPPPPPGGGYGYPQQGGGDPYGYPQQGGGYGPPSPPGPPAPPGGGYGFPAGGPGGYPPGGPGGPGGYPPPPPPDNGKRNMWIAIGCIVAAGAIVGGILVASNSGDDKKKDDAKPKASLTALPSGMPSITLPTPSFTLPSDDPTLDLPSDEPTETVAPTPTEKLVPYVVLSPGKCFDAPTLTPSVSKVTTRSCGSAHDAQVVANETLSGSFTSDLEIQNKALSLCETDARKHLPADGRTYYPYALFPKLVTYQLQNRKTVTCSLTRNNGHNGVKLYSKLG
ncbi:hypothetical protein [Actinacidiphila acidipaludis]|uniref:Septum formation-related domain-containing protein n=1 Tax=Actinacidiphila acidipaludis TaxID=2873382 RepID=A0ABS7Q155_9ACTN|nr:hypothetical protein [Streptomyces acidipaludis]MBY8876616.1 hypothetical protein [Streptomyces acidipaludis]